MEWKKKNPGRLDEEAMFREYFIQFAALCRESGTLRSWLGPVSPLDLEREFENLTEHFLGERVPGRTTFEFSQFSEAQRRLLKYMFDQVTKVWLQHHRRSFAIERMNRKLFPSLYASHS